MKKILTATMALLLVATTPSSQPTKKPNIVIIQGDDIGYLNISAYNQGMMDCNTPNTDRTWMLPDLETLM